MIDIRNIGRDFMPREERFMRPTTPQAPTAPALAAPQAPQVRTGQPAPFAPVAPPTPTPSIPVGIPTQQPFTPVSPTPGWTEGGQPMDSSGVGTGYQFFPPTPISGNLGSPQIGGQPPGGITGTAGPLQPGLPPGMTMEQMRGAMGAGGIPTGGGVPGEPGAGGFPYPEQWQTATDIYGRLAEGMPGMTPEYAQQAWLPYQRQGQEQAMQAREQAGLGGMRWSTPLAGQLESIWGGASERFGSEMERMRMQDIQGQRMAMLGAAGGLGGLGGRYAQLPLTVSESMMRQGMTQQQMQQMELDRQREEWMRQQPEYSPWLQYQAPAATGMPTGPSMYGPSFSGQMFDIAGTLGMYGGGGGVPTAPMGGGYYPEEWGQYR